MRVTWRQMARQLANRLAHQAHCPTHQLADERPDECPYCDDRAAFRAWQAMERRAGKPLTRPTGGNP